MRQISTARGAAEGRQAGGQAVWGDREFDAAAGGFCQARGRTGGMKCLKYHNNIHVVITAAVTVEGKKYMVSLGPARCANGGSGTNTY